MPTPKQKTAQIGFRVRPDTAMMARELRKLLPWWGDKPTLATRVEKAIKAAWDEVCGPR